MISTVRHHSIPRFTIAARPVIVGGHEPRCLPVYLPGAELVLSRDAVVADDLADARYWFETTMVRLAAERATPAGIALLKRALADNRRAITSADGYLATDMALHRSIAPSSPWRGTLCSRLWATHCSRGFPASVSAWSTSTARTC